MIRKYLTPLEMFNEINALRQRNHKINSVMNLCDNSWTKLPPHTQGSILKILKIHKDTDGYYMEYENEEEAYNETLQTIIREIKKEINEG